MFTVHSSVNAPVEVPLDTARCIIQRSLKVHGWDSRILHIRKERKHAKLSWGKSECRADTPRIPGKSGLCCCTAFMLKSCICTCKLNKWGVYPLLFKVSEVKTPSLSISLNLDIPLVCNICLHLWCYPPVQERIGSPNPFKDCCHVNIRNARLNPPILWDIQSYLWPRSLLSTQGQLIYSWIAKSSRSFFASGAIHLNVASYPLTSPNVQWASSTGGSVRSCFWAWRNSGAIQKNPLRQNWRLAVSSRQMGTTASSGTSAEVSWHLKYRRTIILAVSTLLRRMYALLQSSVDASRAASVSWVWIAASCQYGIAHLWQAVRHLQKHVGSFLTKAFVKHCVSAPRRAGILFPGLLRWHRRSHLPWASFNALAEMSCQSASGMYLSRLSRKSWRAWGAAMACSGGRRGW